MIKLENRSFPRYDPLAAAFAQAHKNRVEQRILEFLRNERAPHAEKAGRNGHPFEVTIVTTAENNRVPFLHFFLPKIEVFHLDIAGVIFAR